MENLELLQLNHCSPHTHDKNQASHGTWKWSTLKIIMSRLSSTILVNFNASETITELAKISTQVL